MTQDSYDLVDLPVRVRAAHIGANHEVGGGYFPLGGELCSDSLTRVGFANAIAGHQTLELEARPTGRHHDTVELSLSASFKQKRDVGDRERRPSLSIHLREPPADRGLYMRMDDRLERFPFLGVVEHPCTQPLPVELTIGPKDVVSESPADVGRRRLTCSHHIVGDRIGVNGRHVVGGEAGEDPRLAGGDTTGEGDPEDSHERVG